MVLVQDEEKEKRDKHIKSRIEREREWSEKIALRSKRGRLDEKKKREDLMNAHKKKQGLTLLSKEVNRNEKKKRKRKKKSEWNIKGLRSE